MAPRLAQLEAMSNEELERQYDEVAKTTFVGLEWYREEYRRREAARQTNV